MPEPQNGLSPVDRLFYWGWLPPTPTPTHPCPCCGRDTTGLAANDRLKRPYDDRCSHCRDHGFTAQPLLEEP